MDVLISQIPAPSALESFERTEKKKGGLRGKAVPSKIEMNEEEVTAVENKDNEETSVSETEEDVGVCRRQTPTESESDEVSQFQEEINTVKTELTALKDVLKSKANTENLQVVEEQIETLKKTVRERLETEVNKRNELQQKTQISLDDLTTGFDVLDETVGEIVDVVKAKDKAGRTINPVVIPPIVLQNAYEEITTDVFQQMVKQHGRDVAISKVEAVIEYVRKSSAGMEFFKISSDNQRITAPGLANAIRQKLMSAHQIHVAFTEFLRNLLAEVPGYQPLSLGNLTETGSQEYAVTEVSNLVEQATGFADSLSVIQKSLTETNEKIEALYSRIEKLESANHV